MEAVADLNTAILAPAAVLVAWSLVMLLWVVVTRFPAFRKQGIDLGTAPRGARYVDVEASMPPRVNWVAHNYNHLMEQPTIFYPLVAILAIAGAGENAVMWAWGYTGFRIAHSLWQALVNTVPVRFLLFLCSNICLFVLTFFALKLTLG
jgi:hypothetical protein